MALAATTADAELAVRQVAELNRGMYWSFGNIVPYCQGVGSSRLLVFRGGIPGAANGVHFYRHTVWNEYEIAKIDTGDPTPPPGILPGLLVPWAAGDVDGDSTDELTGDNADNTVSGWYDLAVLCVPPGVHPAPDSLVWYARYDSSPMGYGGTPYYITDLDCDRKKEILCIVRNALRVYENNGHHSMHEVANVPLKDATEFAFGDFDQDGQMEFGTAGISNNNRVDIYKCTGDDQYVRWDSVSIHHPNGHDVFSAANLDGTHQARLFVSFWSTMGWTWLYSFEPIQGTRGYQAFPIDSVTVSGEPSARSVCGDIDGDGVDELVWSTGNEIRVYKCTGPHDFEQVWYWWNNGGASCNLNLYDMNANGYNELLESGDGVTHIFEIEAIRVLYPSRYTWLRPGDTCRIRWQTFNPPRCDSVSLFLRQPPLLNLDTIVHGLSPAETSWLWTVPHIISDSCHIVAIAYGPGWQYDESDTCFRIAPVGVEERPATASFETRLLGVSPNPVSGTARVSFEIGNWGQSTTGQSPIPTSGQSLISLRICDVSGRTVATLADGILKPGVYRRDWEVAPTTPNGVYLLNFRAAGLCENRKLILAR